MVVAQEHDQPRSSCKNHLATKNCGSQEGADIFLQECQEGMGDERLPGFRDRFKQVRKKANWTQAEAARHLGVHERTIAGYEAGVSTPTAETINRLAEICGIDPTWLITGRGKIEVPKGPGIASDTVVIPAEEQKKVEAVTRLLRDLGLSPRYTVVATGFPGTGRRLTDRYTGFEIELVRKVRALTDTQRGLLLQFLDVLSGDKGGERGSGTPSETKGGET